MKKIKFPLVMGNGTEARDIGQLRENFDIGSAIFLQWEIGAVAGE